MQLFDAMWLCTPFIWPIGMLTAAHHVSPTPALEEFKIQKSARGNRELEWQDFTNSLLADGSAAAKGMCMPDPDLLSGERSFRLPCMSIYAAHCLSSCAPPSPSPPLLPMSDLVPAIPDRRKGRVLSMFVTLSLLKMVAFGSIS